MKKKKGFTILDLVLIVMTITLITLVLIPQIIFRKNNATKISMENISKLVANRIELAYKTSFTSEEGFLLYGSGETCLKYVVEELEQFSDCEYIIDSSSGKVNLTLFGKKNGRFNGYTCITNNKIECLKNTN